MEIPSILIADGSGEFRDGLRQTLEKHSRVISAQDGQQALTLLRESMPDMLVLDLMLPGLDGISLLQQAKQQGILPAVLTTTRIVSDYILQALEQLGVEYVIVKPCDMKAVSDRVFDLLRQEPRKREKIADSPLQIGQILRQLGIPTKLKGYAYLKEAVALYCLDPAQSITKELYCEVGRRCNASAVQVERSIRTAIEAAWVSGNSQIWQRYFPGQRKKPTNGAMIAQLANCMEIPSQSA